MLAIGQKAPDFELKGDASRTVRLSDLLKEGPIVLYFYPMDFTPVCTREACMFRDAHSELLKGGLRVYGVSPQTSARHESFRQHHRLPFPLLADTGKKVARAYGALGFLGLTVRRISYLIGADGTIEDAVRADFRLGQHEGFVRRVLAKTGSETR